MSIGSRLAAAAVLATAAAMTLGAPAASAADPSEPEVSHSETNGPSSSSSLIEVNSNNVGPIQLCNNHVPVSVLGVQVPLEQVSGAVGAASDDQKAAAQKACEQQSAQNNDRSEERRVGREARCIGW